MILLRIDSIAANPNPSPPAFFTQKRRSSAGSGELH
jgi:hypothetical protein